MEQKKGSKNMKQGWIQANENGIYEDMAPKTLADLVYLDNTHTETVKHALLNPGGYDLEVLLAEMENKFETWFEGVQTVLEGDVAGNLMTQINNVWEQIYPVDSIYLSVNPTDPSALFGGTWEAWGSGRVPVGVDTAQTEFSTVEKIGGTKTHTLTTAEMPQHQHGVPGRYNSAGFAAAATTRFAQVTSGTTNNGVLTFNVGDDGAHNNLQPYVTCYMWKRTE